MRRHSYWQVASTVILTILLIVPFSFIKAKANTYNANYSLTQYNYYVEKQGTNWATTDIFVNFKAPASGTLTINISPTLSSTYYSFVVISGGNLASSPTTSTTKLTIGVRSQQTVQVRVQSISTQSNAHATYTMSFSGTYEDGAELSLENIESELVTLNSKIDTTNNVLAQINTKLANLSIQDYTTILNTINNSIGSVVTAIENLPDYTSILNSINTYLGSINTNIDDIETICSGIQTTVNNILSTLQNIDTLIDTISWKQISSSYYFKGYSTDKTNIISSISSSVQILKDNWVYFHFKSFASTTPTLYYFRIPFSFGSLSYFGSSMEIEFYNGAGKVIDPEFYYSNADGCTHIFYFGRNASSYDLIIGVKPSNNGYVYSNTFSNSFLKWIDNTDIEYWKLLSIIQQNEFYKGNSESQQAISEQTSTNDQFNYQSNQYHSVESTFQSNFDTAFDAINPSDTVSTLTQYAAAFAWFTNQLGALYDSSGNFKILFTLPLLLGIAMFFLGRGAAVFANPEKASITTSIIDENTSTDLSGREFKTRTTRTYSRKTTTDSFYKDAASRFSKGGGSGKSWKPWRRH